MGLKGSFLGATDISSTSKNIYEENRTISVRSKAAAIVSVIEDNDKDIKQTCENSSTNL